MQACLRVVLLAVAALGLMACDSGPKSSRGFALPDGDVAAGKEAFVELKCRTCHAVKGVELPAPDFTPHLQVPLGGEVYRVRTYGQLVTAVIHPSHRIAKTREADGASLAREGGESRMANYNSTMTVQQLIDLVAFLQSRYVLLEPEYTAYPYS